MSYINLLMKSAAVSGNCVCMGLDPQPEWLPYGREPVREGLKRYFSELFAGMKQHGLLPAAFKPNLGFYHGLDHPRRSDFSGSLLLGDVLGMLEEQFPGIPVILDSKRGDIARSSKNYAVEAFDGWQVDALTVSPYMGWDSVFPFLEHNSEEKGVYLLNRTSNAGGRDFQNLLLENGMPLHAAVTRTILKWAADHPGTGAVVGATHLQELESVVRLVAGHSIPLLIPGVGAQGGNAEDTLKVLSDAGYPLELARINSSSGLTHPWKTTAVPADWLEQCLTALQELLRVCAI